MIKIIRNITILLSIIFVGYLGYHAFFNDSAVKWSKYVKPQLAAYASLEQDEEILKELDLLTRYSSYKSVNEGKYYTKPTIFQAIERR